MNNNEINITMINGTIALHRSVNFILVIPEATNRFTPTGGVINAMAMAQSADILLLSTEQYAGKVPLFLGINNVRFLKKILPGDTIEIQAKLVAERREKAIATCSAQIYNHSELCTCGEVTLAMR